MKRELGRVKGSRLLLIPGSEDTRGHGTTAKAKFRKAPLQELLRATARHTP